MTEDFLNEIIDSISAERREECAEAGQLTIGEVIYKLEDIVAKGDKSRYKPVKVGSMFIGNNYHSYRGFYEDLAIGCGARSTHAGMFLGRSRNASGSVYEGYKGGDFQMTDDSLVWIATEGHEDGAMVVGIVEHEDYIEIVTKETNRYYE